MHGFTCLFKCMVHDSACYLYVVWFFLLSWGWGWGGGSEYQCWFEWFQQFIFLFSFFSGQNTLLKILMFSCALCVAPSLTIVNLISPFCYIQ